MIRRIDRFCTRFLDVMWERLLPAVLGVIGMLVVLTVSAQLFGWGQA